MTVALEHNTDNPDGDQITLPYLADDVAVDEAVDAVFKDRP
jgi:hypothetical protein